MFITPDSPRTTGYGWSPSLPDHKDYIYTAAPQSLQSMPSTFNLLNQTPPVPPVREQLNLGSCTGFGVGSLLHYEIRKQNLPEFTPSPLFIYFGERVLENTQFSDSGAQIRDGIKSVATQGFCSEGLWPYDVNKWAQQPSQEAYAFAAQHKAIQYESVPQNLMQMKACIFEGYPFVLGFVVYESFESEEMSRTGVMSMPSPQEQVVGGHCVSAWGWSDQTQSFLLRNSWGNWGQQGYFTMPYAYITQPNLASDFWKITIVQ